MENHSFIIKGVFYGKTHTFPDLNDYLKSCGTHPHVGAKMKRDYMMIASNAIRRQLGGLKISVPVKIHYFFYEGSFATKVIEDALQKCGVLKNDNQVWVKGYTHDFFIDEENPRIEVTIEELE